MKFAEIIRASGSNPENFPKIAELDIVLLNAKQERFEDDKLEFDQSSPIFVNNPSSRAKFEDFLDKFETGLEDGSIPVARLRGTLTIDTLVITHFQSFHKLFFRQ